MKLRHFALFALWHYALVDSQIKMHECCPNNNTMVGFVCEDEKVSNQNKSVLQCSTEMFEFDLESVKEEVDFDEQDFESFCFGNKVQKHNETETQNTKTKRVVIVCIPEYNSSSMSKFGSIVIPSFLLMSIIGLILTLIVHIIVPDLRDIQGLSTACLCGSFALGYLHLLAQSVTSYKTEGVMCYILGFGMYYWIIAAFFWMNVISIDIMRTVTLKNGNKTDKRQFLYYSMYGWGIPLILLLITVCATFIDGYHIKSKIGDNSCWFYEYIEIWSYFYAPIAIILITNLVLFGVASKGLWYKPSYNNVTKLKNMKYKFYLYAKLLIIYGIFWIFELLISLFDGLYVARIISGILNSLSGVIYFLLLVVFRKRARRGLVKLGLRIPCVSNNEELEEEEILEDDNQP